MSLVPQIAAETAPAGGAATTQLIVMVISLSIGFAAVAILGELHKRGRRTPLGTAAAFSERVSGLPAWAAIPLGICAVALPGALFGYMWDASLHIGQGRDDGPFANPSHYFILAGLYGIIAAGYLSTVLARSGETPGRSALKVAPDRYVPLGGALILASGFFAFAGFPLDDIWHRLFGQDVTLWGPTHLIMLGGGMLTLVGIAILFEEGVASAKGRPERFKARQDGSGRARSRPLLARLADLAPDLPVWPTRALISGGFLAGLSIFQGEFDYGVPQFELVLQPLMFAVAAGIALVAARIWVGPWGAIGAAGFYVVIRGIVALIVGPILGETTPAAPLYIPEAIMVELAAVLLLRDQLRHAVAFGAVSGLAIGTFGFAAEWPWVNSVFAIEWTEALMPEGLIVAAVGGLAAGTLGAYFGLALKRRLAPAPRHAGSFAAASLATIIGCFAFGLADRNPEGVSAQVTLADVKPAPEREVIATVRFTPGDLAEGASWVRYIAWQGGGLVGGDFEEISPGVFRTPEPVPVHGDWKSAIRVHNGHTLMGTSIYAPEDLGIPAPEIPATASFTREMGPDREMLQRERKDDVAPWLWTAASVSVALLFAGFSVLLVWGLTRYSRGASGGGPPRTERLRGTQPTGAA